MKTALSLNTGIMFCLLASHTTAAVDITGFTVNGGGAPIGLILISVLLLGLGASAIKRA
ncbi:hypothetical protein N9Y37_01800 [Luminiphilus sp.]|nr:hypothetical protein [Luminiphilus sp.]